MRVPVQPLRDDFCGESSCDYCYHNVADNETETAIDDEKQVEVIFDLLSRDVTPNETPTVSKTDGEDICNRILQVENLTAIYRERGEA